MTTLCDWSGDVPKTKTTTADHPPEPSPLPPWHEVEDLVAGLDVSAETKYLLERVRRYTNPRKHFAWVSQQTLAREMSVSLSTVGRAFAEAKRLGVIAVRRVRTGKLPSDQHNEFWLVPPRMRDLQRTAPGEQPSPVTCDTNDGKSEHTPAVTCDTSLNTGQKKYEHTSNGAGTHVTGDVGSTKYFKNARKQKADERNRPPYAEANRKADDCVPSVRRSERTKDEAAKILHARGHDPNFVAKVLKLIRKKARNEPATSRYYIASFDAEAIDDWKCRVDLDFVHETVETAHAEGRRARDVLRERLANEP